MSVETIHFVLELTVALITLGLGGLFAYILKIESRISRLEEKIENLGQLVLWSSKKREND